MPGINIFKKAPHAMPEGKPTTPAATNFSHPHIYVQPCVINNQPYVIYPKGLQEKSPELFQQLKEYYTARHYALKEEQRQTNHGRPQRKDRRRWAPIVLFTASLLFEANASAEIQHETHNTLQNQPQTSELRLIPKEQPDGVQSQERVRSLKESATVSNTILKAGVAGEIFTLLRTHYKQQSTDPAYIIDDLKQIANYYSEFPEVIALLEPLKNKKWQLTYDENNWDTVAIGNMFQVDRSIIHFNTRSAAQLLLNLKCKDNPVCIASPADALLHELLHAYSMLVDTSQFIAQGGMNNVLYPYRNEYAVIDAERKLYAEMSNRDEIRRPLRTDHTGRAVKASCPLCIK